MISFEDALAKIAAGRPALATERIPLEDALGAQLANPLTARISRPPAAVSAMDGYAVRLADVGTAGTILDLIGAAPAGTPFSGTTAQGQTVRIFTGGELPDGTNHVIPQENARADGNKITIIPASKSARFVRAEGLDFSAGDVVLPAGIRLGPAQLTIAAAANCDTLEIHKRPIVALLANGDELKPAGTSLKRGEIVNSNPSALSALIKSWGGIALDLGIAGDTVSSIHTYLEKAEMADIIVPVGGASVGDHDHMFAAFEHLGFTTVFRKVAVKPGKPTWCAVKGRQITLGLPGNPASALVCAHLFLKPLVTGKPVHRFVQAKLTQDLHGNGPRAEFLRSSCEIDQDGQLWVTPLPNQDSSLLHPFQNANVLLYREIDAAPAYVGTQVAVLPIGPLVP